MSVTQVPLQPLKKGSMLKLWLGIALIVVAAVALAWVGTDRFRGEMTANGVFIRTLDAGTGDPIRVNDGVLVEYEGRLADGKVFDSSNGKPVPMLPSQLIPGFSEALQNMREGGSYSIRIPSALAYGAQGAGNGEIPPNADLLFDIKIHQLVRDAALMMGPQQGAAPQPGAPAPGTPQP